MFLNPSMLIYVWRNINIFWYFTSYLLTDMTQVIEIRPDVRQRSTLVITLQLRHNERDGV